jgi:DNA-binding ferritin-like protein
MMPDQKLLGQALSELADWCNCIGGDFHTLHLNMHGQEFDRLHRDVLQDYYEQCDSDYDSFAEWAQCYDFVAPNKNESATRIKYQSYNGTNDREQAINKSAELLDTVCTLFKDTYNSFNAITDCPIAIGITNFIQTRLEYWAKEMAYFNKERK